MLEIFNRDNILQSLNDIDARSNNKFDLVNMYSSKSLNSKQLNKLSEMLENKVSLNNLHQFLEDIEEDKPAVSQKEFEDLIMELNEYLRSNGLYEFAYQVEEDTFEVEINWGDWKHEHIWLTELVYKFLKDKGYDKANGYKIIHDTDITEEDGSDTYSAIHTFEIVAYSEDKYLEDTDEY